MSVYPHHFLVNDLSVCLSVYPHHFLVNDLSVCLSVYPHHFLMNGLSVYPHHFLVTGLCLSVCLTHTLTDPHGFTLAKLCVLCITGTQTSKISQKGG